MSRLSQSLLNGGSFSLKYQLPSEDLDSLISVTTDEDLENMIEEYERTTSNYQKPCRLRLFLFQQKLESSQSVLETKTIKSDEWFLNALNGAAGVVLNRGFSDSASVNCLLGLDDEIVAADAAAVSGGAGSGGGMVKKVQDVHSVPDSPMMETTSSFGSSSSSPSLANLPPIRVHVEESGKVQEQFGQMNISGGSGGGQKLQQEEGFVVMSSPHPPPVVTTAATVGLVSGEYVNRVVSDDERSDHGVPVGFKKAPPPPQPLPQKSSGGGGGGVVLDLPSPDSISSDSSLTNAISRQKPMIYQDSVVQIPSGGNRVAVNVNPVDPTPNVSDPNARVHVQQIQDPGSGYVFQSQLDQQQPQQPQQQQQLQQQPQQLQQQQLPQQQQFVHAGGHYIHHHPAGAMPISAYYPVYPSQQQPQVHHHQHQHQVHQLDQQYPVYYVPAGRQPQAYNLSVQQQSHSVSESPTAITSSRPQTPPNPSMVPPPAAAYNPMRNTHITKPEMAAAAGVYRTTTTGTPQMVQVPSSQQQYVNYSQIHHPSQSVAPTSAAMATANYGYEYADPAHSQIYYTQPLAPTMPSQYQTMTEASAQLSNENIKQQIRTSQAL